MTVHDVSPLSRGSSPLARGLHGRVGVKAEDRRIIPARAGFTPTVTASVEMRSDHPRSRGVYVSEDADLRLRQRIIPARAGFTRVAALHRHQLPDHPRSRGVYALDAAVGHLDLWIIPARAGFTLRRGRLTRPRPDHPRSRGVYAIGAEEMVNVPGSSPLARGLQNITAQLASNNGIIPARAGFTRRGAGRRRRSADHPRSRGVYW